MAICRLIYSLRTSQNVFSCKTVLHLASIGREVLGAWNGHVFTALESRPTESPTDITLQFHRSYFIATKNFRDLHDCLANREISRHTFLLA